jgi:hypothetical protein
MMDNQANEFTAEEKAFFDGRGEVEFTETPAAAPTPVETPTPAAAVQPETPVEGDVLQARDEKGKFIPHSVFHAEREEHKKTRQELEEVRRQQAILNDRWNTLLQAKPQQEAQAETPPDPNEDLFGFIKWQGDQVAALKAQTEEQRKADQQAREWADQEQQISTFWQSSVQEYASKTPEFTDAATWLSEYRHKQLEALAAIDPQMANPAARNAQIDLETKQIINMAKQRGQNPAELIHQLAKGWGFQPKAPAPATPVQTNDKLDQLETALKASQTLTASNGKGATEPMSVQALIEMPEREFSVWLSKPENAKLYKQLMGG